jgi:serine/threonine-protein kinase
MRQAVALAERAAAVEPSKYPGAYSLFLFARGLAEYRRGHFDRAVGAIRGDPDRMLIPAPGLVLAMALHRSGQTAEARKVLAAALTPEGSAIHRWFLNDWSAHVLRREAEALILPNLAAFLDGKYQPQDNNERLALLGAGQFANRPLALARRFADAFAADPDLTESLAAGHRYRAARVAALAGCGRGEDAPGLGEEEAKRWRGHARQWLRADLTAWNQALASASAASELWRTLKGWRYDTDLAGLRDPIALEKLPAEERKEWLALWKEVEALLSRTASP